MAVKGDWGAGSEQQAAVTRAMCEERGSRPFDDVVTTGDNFYDPDGVAGRGNYFEPESCLISYGPHTWRATWGNHDLVGDSTSSELGAERFYRWTIGEAEFFMLDSNALDAEQLEWFNDSIAASAAVFRIAVFHHPPYTSGTAHPPDAEVRKKLVPILREHSFHLVLNGHAHNFERALVDGVNYVVTGGGGRFLHPCGPPGLGSLTCEATWHFLLLSLDDDGIGVDAIRPNGSRLDSFRIAR